MQGGYQTLDLSGITLTQSLIPGTSIDIGDFKDVFDLIFNCDKVIMTKMPKMLFDLSDTGISSIPEIKQTYSCWIYNTDKDTVSTAIPLYILVDNDSVLVHLALSVTRSQIYAELKY